MKRIAAARAPAGKRTGHTLPAVMTEKVCNFLEAILLQKYDDDDDKLDTDARKLNDEILKAISG